MHPLRRLSLSLSLLLAVLAFFWSPSSKAGETRRYAVVIGANRGLPDESPLRYAEHDAERVAELLHDLGGVYEENIVLLRGNEAKDVERVLGEMGDRIARDQKSKGVSEALLVFYYSGHADRNGLHLNGTALHYRRLTRLLERAPAKARILVVDACQSR